MTLKVEWHKLEPEHAPPPVHLHGKLLWIIERFYNDGDVVVGRYTTGDHWEYTTDGGDWYDDCLVTHCAEMTIPEPPEGLGEDGD